MADYIFYVKVANSKFVLDSVSQATIALGHDITYRFDQSDSTNAGNTIAFSTTSDGTHNSGSAYTTGVTTTGTAGSSGAYVDIAVTSSTPASLYYYSAGNSGYGSAVITTGNTHVTTNNLGLLLPILADATDQWGSHINQSLRKIEDTFGANADVYTYNITGDTTAITGSATAGGTLAFNDGQHIEVYLNGVKLVGNLSSGNDYTLNASTDTITLASNAVNGDVVNVVVFKTFQFADAVPASTGGTFSGNVAVNGDLTVDTDTLKVDSSGGHIGIGTASPTTFSGYKTLHFKNASGDTAFLNETDGGVIHETLTSDSNSCAFTGTRSAHALKFRTNQYERMSIASSANDTANVTVTKGNLVIGTAGQGITFSSTNTPAQSYGTGSHNTLDDYEEGTFTPLIGGTNVSVGTNNDGITGHYVKIGRQVTFVISILNQTISGTGVNHYIQNLPFTNGSIRSVTSHPLWINTFNETASVVGLIQYSSNNIEFLSQGATTWSAESIVAGSGRYLHVHGVYFTDY